MITGDHAILSEYLSANGDPNLLYRDRSLVHWAAQESDYDAVRLLLAKGASTETADGEGHFPLYQAAAEGSLETVRLLVEAGAEVNRMCDSGTALSIACAFEHTDVAHFLMIVGADPDLADGEGTTARSIAESYESPELLRLMKNG